MAQTITISTRAEWGKYLRQQAGKMMRLQSERHELRKLVVEALDLRARMPKDWVRRAEVALSVIRE